MKESTGKWVRIAILLLLLAIIAMTVLFFVLKAHPITVSVSDVRLESVFRGYEETLRGQFGDDFFSNEMNQYRDASKADPWEQWLWDGDLPSMNSEDYVCLLITLEGKNRFLSDYYREGALLEHQGTSPVRVITVHSNISPTEYSRLKGVSGDWVAAILYVGNSSDKEIETAVRELEFQLCFRKESGEQLIVPISLEGLQKIQVNDVIQ